MVLTTILVVNDNNDYNDGDDNSFDNNNNDDIDDDNDGDEDDEDDDADDDVKQWPLYPLSWLWNPISWRLPQGESYDDTDFFRVNNDDNDDDGDDDAQLHMPPLDGIYIVMIKIKT